MLVEPWLVRAARSRPDHEALRTPQGSLSYAELLAAARRAAGALTPGATVAIALPPGRDFAVTLHGCLLAGAVAVPLDLRLGERERTEGTARRDLVADALLEGDPVEPRPPDPGAPAVVVATPGAARKPKPGGPTHRKLPWGA